MGRAAKSLLAGFVLIVVARFVRATRSQPEPAAPAGPAHWPPLVPSPDDATAAAAPEEASGPRPWMPPHPDGSPPDGYPVKAKRTSGIYHVPGGVAYERTFPDRCYPSAEAAEADGFRAAKR